MEVKFEEIFRVNDQFLKEKIRILSRLLKINKSNNVNIFTLTVFKTFNIKLK